MSIILENDCSDKHRRDDEDVLTIREMMDMLANHFVLVTLIRFSASQ